MMPVFKISRTIPATPASLLLNSVFCMGHKIWLGEKLGYILGNEETWCLGWFRTWCLGWFRTWIAVRLLLMGSPQTALVMKVSIPSLLVCDTRGVLCLVTGSSAYNRDDWIACGGTKGVSTAGIQND